MAAQTGGKGNFLLVSSTSTAANQNTWIAYMRKYIPTKYPHMHIAQVIPGNDDPATVLSVTSSYLSAHKSSTTSPPPPFAKLEVNRWTGQSWTRIHRKSGSLTCRPPMSTARRTAG
jgi:hypothetical protein